jgi:hypothetical protein
MAAKMQPPILLIAMLLSVAALQLSTPSQRLQAYSPGIGGSSVSGCTGCGVPSCSDLAGTPLAANCQDLHCDQYAGMEAVNNGVPVSVFYQCAQCERLNYLGVTFQPPANCIPPGGNGAFPLYASQTVYLGGGDPCGDQPDGSDPGALQDWQTCVQLFEIDPGTDGSANNAGPLGGFVGPVPPQYLPSGTGGAAAPGLLQQCGRGIAQACSAAGQFLQGCANLVANAAGAVTRACAAAGSALQQCVQGAAGAIADGCAGLAEAIPAGAGAVGGCVAAPLLIVTECCQGGPPGYGELPGPSQQGGCPTQTQSQPQQQTQANSATQTDEDRDCRTITVAGPYASLADPPGVGPGLDFADKQKEAILYANWTQNGQQYWYDEPEEDPSGNRFYPLKVFSDLSGTPMKWDGNMDKLDRTVDTNDPNAPQIDHICPKSLGGTNSYANAQVLTRQENNAKSNIWPWQPAFDNGWVRPNSGG